MKPLLDKNKMRIDKLKWVAGKEEKKEDDDDMDFDSSDG
jgi:hypothetical protein